MPHLTRPEYEELRKRLKTIQNMLNPNTFDKKEVIMHELDESIKILGKR